jgi:glycosyltransferase involved in cell wall biosynthesis
VKVLVIHNSYQHRGGEEIVHDQEVRLLRSRGVQVVEYSRNNELPERLSITERMRLAQTTVWSSSTWREVRDLVNSEHPDIAHVHNTLFRISPSVYWACKASGVPLVQTLHNFRLLCPGGQFVRSSLVCEECVERGVWHGVRYGCYRNSRTATAAVALMLTAHKWARTWTDCIDAYIALSEFSRNKFVAAGMSAAKIFLKPNFVDPDPGVGEGQEYALFLGRLYPEKGLRSLISAWKLLEPQIPLLIVGDGPMRDELHQQAAGLEAVQFCGPVERPLAMSMLKRARFLVMPSECYENFPCAIAEAYACGVPVLASSMGSLVELVQPHRTGLHFRAGDFQDLARCVAWCWSHPQELRAMGLRARSEFENRYSAEKNYSMLMDIYNRVIARHNGHAYNDGPIARLASPTICAE